MAFSSRRALLACGRGLRCVLLAVPFLCYLIPYVHPIYDRIRELNEARGEMADMAGGAMSGMGLSGIGSPSKQK